MAIRIRRTTLLSEGHRFLWRKVYAVPVDVEFWASVEGITKLRNLLSNSSNIRDIAGTMWSKIALLKNPFLEGDFVEVTEKNFEKVTKRKGTETTKWVFVTPIREGSRQRIWIPSGPKYKDALHCAAHVLGLPEADLQLIQRFG